MFKFLAILLTVPLLILAMPFVFMRYLAHNMVMFFTSIIDSLLLFSEPEMQARK